MSAIFLGRLGMLGAMIFALAEQGAWVATGAESVGRRPGGETLTPVEQRVTPVGSLVDLPGMRPQVLALSPDGRLLVTSGKTAELVVIDPATARIRQRVVLPDENQKAPQPSVVSPNILKPDKQGQASYTGLIFSPDGRRIYLSNVNGSVKVFSVRADGHVAGEFTMSLPRANAPRRPEEIPAGLAISADGRRLYVALNLSNQLAEMDADTGRLLRLFPVGVAPYDVVLAEGKAYVSNWGGRRPGAGDLTGPAGRGTEVRVDPVRHIAMEGSVSVIDLQRGEVLTEILTGLHASGLAVSPNGRQVVCANAGSDTVSVLDTRNDRVVETIWVKSNPADLFGASPNALSFDKSGRFLYVANGTQNAVAVVRMGSGRRGSELVGLVPVGWFPGAVVCDHARKAVYVANIKGMPERASKNSQGLDGFNSHQYYGSISLFPMPHRDDLPELTSRVLQNYRFEQLQRASLPARPGVAPRPIPERIGEPSVFRHVVYIIKENRTYDQVFGALKRGNGDPRLSIFGEEITPNQHKMVQEFVLMDNAYCAGILSADGHQWSTTGFATDYMEKSFAGFPRSYPDGMGEDENDALAYSPAGFIWDLAVRHGKSVRNYGEFAMPKCGWSDPKRSGSPKWKDYWAEFQLGRGEVKIRSEPSIESIRGFTPTNTVGWIMEVPDVWRARFFTNELQRFEAEGNFPNLVIICLPNDHTSGTSPDSPTPAACVADNDLAFGQIVEAISHSRFWKETVIFAIEDDPQAGWDHVSGYRTTAYCISPYTRRGAVVSQHYSTVSILRTIEHILGLPAMNQFDATATPMFECFTDQANWTPFKSVPNRVPLDQMNPPARALKHPLQRQHAMASARLNFKKVDACPEGLLNRILWHAMKGPNEPYPQWAIQVNAGDEEEEEEERERKARAAR